MKQHFLYVAEQILEQKKPNSLAAKDIVQYGISEGLLNTNGKTPVNTMRARLSEHIKLYGKKSMFYRVGKNRFALRAHAIEPEYQFYEKEYVIAIKQTEIDRNGRFFGYKKSHKRYLKSIFQNSQPIIVKRTEANKRYDIKQLVAYVIIRYKNKYLLYRRGSDSGERKVLSQVLSIGFGGHVSKEDYENLFSSDDWGLLNCAIREVKEEVKKIKIEDPKIIGIINDDSSLLGFNHFGVVFETRIIGDLQDDYKTEMAINQLNLLSIREISLKFSELEFWSQLILSSKIDSKYYRKTSVKGSLNNVTGVNPILVIGEIGSGKSEVCSILSKELNIKSISTRNCVGEIIGLEDFGTNSREIFQAKAIELINSADGFERIALKVIEHINKVDDGFAVVDGVRNIDTLEIILKTFPNLSLIYVDTARNTAWNYYRNRSKGREVLLKEFRNAREHAVEKEIPFFKYRADAFVYNNGDLISLKDELNKWLKKYKNE